MNMLVLVLLVPLAACSRALGEAPEPEPAPPGPTAEAHDDGALHVDPGLLRDLRLTTTVVAPRPRVETVQAIGEIRLDPDAASRIGSLVSARIVELRAKVGDVLAAGTPVAVLESPEVGRARADLIAARAQLAAAQRILGRKQRLGAEQLVSASDADRASAEVARARGEVDAAQALLAALGADTEGEATTGGRFTVRAPAAGTVLARAAILGAHADAEETLFEVGDLSRIVAVVHPFERDAIRVRPGRPADIALAAAPGRSFVGEVVRTSPQVDPISHALDVVLSVHDPEHVARPGMTVVADLALGAEGDQVITVPIAALQRLDDDWVVFRPQGEAGRYEIIKVGRGRDLGDAIEIVSGLAAGDTVVVDGAFILKAEAAKARGGGGEHDD